jgi:hypothetical protein
VLGFDLYPSTTHLSAVSNPQLSWHGVVPPVCMYPAGYYPAGAPPKSNSQAQIDMIDETLKWAGVDTVNSVSVWLCCTNFNLD